MGDERREKGRTLTFELCAEHVRLSARPTQTVMRHWLRFHLTAGFFSRKMASTLSSTARDCPSLGENTATSTRGKVHRTA